MTPFLQYASIALRNIMRNQRRSLLTILAIAFGLCCLVVFQALKQGLHQSMVQSTVALDVGTLQIHARGFQSNLTVLKALENPDLVEQALHNLGVTSFSRRLKSPALLLAGDMSSTVIIAGVEPAREPAVTFIAKKLTSGVYLADDRSILLGNNLAASLGVGVGDQITLMVQNVFRQATPGKFRVAGIYRTALPSFDRSHVFMTITGLQSFLAADGMVSEIVVQSDPARAAALAAKLQPILPAASYVIQTWEDITPDVRQLIELNDATMRLLILIVFAIVAMGITNTMSTVIFERFRELGTMAALGTTPAEIITMIVLESFFLGAIASVVGSVVAVLACSYLGHYGIDLTRFTSANQYFADSHVLKAHLTMNDLLLANLITLATGLLAGIYPAWKAGRLDPVKAIQHT